MSNVKLLHTPHEHLPTEFFLSSHSLSQIHWNLIWHRFLCDAVNSLIKHCLSKVQLTRNTFGWFLPRTLAQKDYPDSEVTDRPYRIVNHGFRILHVSTHLVGDEAAAYVEQKTKRHSARHNYCHRFFSKRSAWLESFRLIVRLSWPSDMITSFGINGLKLDYLFVAATRPWHQTNFWMISMKMKTDPLSGWRLCVFSLRKRIFFPKFDPRSIRSLLFIRWEVSYVNWRIVQSRVINKFMRMLYHSST